jgi:hypothetical protein
MLFVWVYVLPFLGSPASLRILQGRLGDFNIYHLLMCSLGRTSYLASAAVSLGLGFGRAF